MKDRRASQRKRQKPVVARVTPIAAPINVDDGSLVLCSHHSCLCLCSIPETLLYVLCLFGSNMEHRGPTILSSEDLLYEELWKACTGPQVDVPRDGERVFYFPQGHMEQLEASTNQELNQGINLFNLNSKLLCRVVHTQLLPGTQNYNKQ